MHVFFIQGNKYGGCVGWGYTHDSRADKNPYPHDRRADKDSYLHDRNVTDDLCSLIKLCYAFLWLIFLLNVFYCYSCWKLFTLKSAFRIIKKKCITDIDKSVKNRWLITARVIKIKTMILFICITLLIVTFSVIIVSKIKLWFNWYSFYSLINFDMHDRFWQVSDTMGMPIRQKLWIKLRSAEFHIIRIKWKSIYLSIKGSKCKISNSNTQVSRKVITGSFDDLQHIVHAQLKTIILTHSCKIEQISKNNMKSIKQASVAH